MSIQLTERTNFPGEFKIDISRQEERDWKKDVSARVLAFRKEIEAESPEWVADRRREYLQGLLDKANKKLMLWKLSCGRLTMLEKKEKVKYWLVRFADEMNPFKKDVAKIKKQIDWVSNRQEIKSGHVTQEMIDRANAVPIEKLIDPELLIKGKMLCPFHNDSHPSMQIKNGFGYCHACHKHMNSIHYIRMTRNLSFFDAVKALQ